MLLGAGKMSWVEVCDDASTKPVGLSPDARYFLVYWSCAVNPERVRSVPTTTMFCPGCSTAGLTAVAAGSEIHGWSAVGVRGSASRRTQGQRGNIGHPEIGRCVQDASRALAFSLVYRSTCAICFSL